MNRKEKHDIKLLGLEVNLFPLTRVGLGQLNLFHLIFILVWLLFRNIITAGEMN